MFIITIFNSWYRVHFVSFVERVLDFLQLRVSHAIWSRRDDGGTSIHGGRTQAFSSHGDRWNVGGNIIKHFNILPTKTYDISVAYKNSIRAVACRKILMIKTIHIITMRYIWVNITIFRKQISVWNIFLNISPC